MFERFEASEKSTEQLDQSDQAFHGNFRPTDKPPPGHGEVQDARVSDKLKRPLTLRTEDGTQAQLERALEAGADRVDHPIRVRTYDGGQEAGYANLTLEVEKLPDNTIEHFVWPKDRRMRIGDIFVPEDDRRRGIGTWMLERSEELARQSGAREIYGTLESEQARSFFKRNGYQFRPGPYGEEAYKSYYFR